MLHIVTEWTFEPWLLACIALATAPYLIGMARMDAGQRAKILGPLRVSSFLSGMLILFLALESPLDAMADDLFSAHMAQHMLLLLVIPALLVYGRPVITWLWAFDLDARRSIVHGWKRSRLQAVFDWLMHPLWVWLLLTAALVFWHFPGPYDWAVTHEWLHDLEHLSFLAISLQFWTIVIEPYGQRRRLGFGETIVFVVSAGVVMGLIGAVLTFAMHPLYAVHLHTTQAWGLTPLEDQELAGVIMWIPSNLVHIAALCTVFFAWYGADQRAAGQRSVARPRAGGHPMHGMRGTSSAKPRAVVHSLLVLPALTILLGGCAGRPSPEQMQVRHGAQLIDHYGCGSCHTIPGINDANGVVGPPLTHWHNRSYIAGVLPNTPDYLAFWIEHPQKVIKGVDMPDMGVQPQEAHDIAAYLDTIH